MVENTLLTKALTRGHGPELKRDEVLDIVFWTRCLLGLFIGTVAGVLKLSGWPVFAAFGVLTFGGGHFYITRFLECDMEDGDINPNEYMHEGTMNSLAWLVLTWIITYSHL